jgi:hypothetical protein
MPDTELKISDFKGVSLSTIEVEDEHYAWQSCLGGSTDSRLLKFCAIYFTLFQVIIFCIVMIYKTDAPEDQTTYISLLTFILGLIIPTGK